MSIMWKYLDKRSATIAAIKDYEAMQFIIDNTDAEIKRAHEKMTSLGSPKWDGMPRTHNPQAGEERILKAIDEIDILKGRPVVHREVRRAVSGIPVLLPAHGRVCQKHYGFLWRSGSEGLRAASHEEGRPDQRTPHQERI